MFEFFSGICTLFIRPANTFFSKNNFKNGSTALFTHLKIILLQYFQFSVINGIQTNPKGMFGILNEDYDMNCNIYY